MTSLKLDAGDKDLICDAISVAIVKLNETVRFYDLWGRASGYTAEDVELFKLKRKQLQKLLERIQP